MDAASLLPTDRSARAVRAVAYVFVFVATATVFIAPVGSILLFLAAQGLLARNAGWRKVALVFIVLDFLAACAWAVMLSYGLAAGKPQRLSFCVFGPGAATIAWIAMFLLLASSVAVTAWLWHLLNKRSVRELFGAGQPLLGAASRLAVRMMLVFGVLGLACGGLWAYVGHLEHPQSFSAAVGAPGKGATMVDYGYRFGKLAWVVFNHSDGPQVCSSVQGSETEPVLGLPDGRKLPLPNRIQLYEVINGVYRESAVRVTRRQFEAFMASNPKDCAIDSLISFSKAGYNGGSSVTPQSCPQSR